MELFLYIFSKPHPNFTNFFLFMGGKLFVAEMFSWKSSILNLHFYSQICGKYNHGASFVFNNGALCLQNSLSVRWHEFYLLLGLCVSWLVVTGVGFVLVVGC